LGVDGRDPGEGRSPTTDLPPTWRPWPAPSGITGGRWNRSVWGTGFPTMGFVTVAGGGRDERLAWSSRPVVEAALWRAGPASFEVLAFEAGVSSCWSCSGARSTCLPLAGRRCASSCRRDWLDDDEGRWFEGTGRDFCRVVVLADVAGGGLCRRGCSSCPAAAVRLVGRRWRPVAARRVVRLGLRRGCRGFFGGLGEAGEGVGKSTGWARPRPGCRCCPRP